MDDFTFTSSLHYADPVAAVEWLEQVFGFELTMAVEGPPDRPEWCHYEMAIAGRGRVMIGGEWSATSLSPLQVDGVNTQRVHVQLHEDLDGHCERSRAAGARIDAEPSDQFYGERTYRALDLEGHLWTFAMHVRDVTIAEAATASGLKITATRWQ